MCAAVVGRNKLFEVGGKGGNALSFVLNLIVKSVSFDDNQVSLEQNGP